MYIFQMLANGLSVSRKEPPPLSRNDPRDRGWESTYKIRTSVERSINHIKDSFCLGDRRTQDARTLHADLLLAGITQLITVVVADRIHKPQYFRSLKRLTA